MNCTICNSEKTKVRFIKNEFRILQCLNCGHSFTDFNPSVNEVNQIYSDDYFFKGGAGYSDYTLEKDMLIKRGEYYADKIRKYIPIPGKLLDVGAAAGFILKGFENKGWTGKGVEPNGSMVEYGIKNLGVQIEKGTIEDVNIEQQFDLIVMIQVAAHIYNLHNSFKKINQLLKPNGHILIETWNKDSLTAKMFGRNWHEYSPPGTLNYFSKKSLNRLLQQHGFTDIAGGKPQKKIHSSHAKSLIKAKLKESRGLKWMLPFTRLIPPNMILPYPAEDLFWALYQRGK